VPTSQLPGKLELVGLFDTGPLAGAVETRRALEVVEKN
jgi:hypothetical protein